MEKLKEYYTRVEDALRLVGVDPALCRSEDGEDQWNLTNNNQEIWIDVIYVEENKRSFFQLMMPLVETPTTNVADFYKDLLEINYKLIDAQLCLFNEGVYLKIMREIEFMTPEEIFVALNRIGHYGHYLETELTENYKVGKVKHKEDLS